MRVVTRLVLISAATAIFAGAAAPPGTRTETDASKKMEESVAKQKAAVQRQVGAAPPGGFFTTSWMSPVPPPAAPPCERLPESEVASLIARSAAENRVDAVVLREMIRQESGFRPCAVSPKGALGMMQLMPETAARFKVADPFEPGGNIFAGARYLRELLDRFSGDLRLALAGYNAGPEAVDKANRAVPDISETRDYVQAILNAIRVAGAH